MRLPSSPSRTAAWATHDPNAPSPSSFFSAAQALVHTAPGGTAIVVPAKPAAVISCRPKPRPQYTASPPRFGRNTQQTQSLIRHRNRRGRRRFLFIRDKKEECLPAKE